ncbi:four-carbon acid sugar kinase family protein [Pseudoroseomonas globiformis]|uniref:Four-carbon acid sugar kinase family protein n=1 Tax=Teichococcus globiformis TaxID=2307229 RepID=A0ABV7G6B2_9PROT
MPQPVRDPLDRSGCSLQRGGTLPATPSNWLILADDLTGAADCAVAFARRGRRAVVAWGGTVEPGAGILAIDADSRRLPAAQASARHAQILRDAYRPATALFKKIDSTLRGQPAAELAGTLEMLRESGAPRLALVAPAFPANRRTLRNGRVHVEGQSLESTPLWARDHSYNSAFLPEILAMAGLRVRALGLDAVRGGEASLRNTIRAALAEGLDALVCDSDTSADLQHVARAALPLAADLVWVGSAGLADALAAILPASAGPALPERRFARSGGLLFLVGSVAEASRAAAAELAAQPGVGSFVVPPAVLRQGGGEDWHVLADGIAATLLRGEDALVAIETGDHPDLAHGAELARGLAALLQKAGSAAGGLFATGGETACALLAALGIRGIEMQREIEPGVPLGLTLGRRSMPVVTKAGAFGHPDTMTKARQQLRALLDEPAGGKKDDDR